MSKTKIEWTETTWSPITGCTKISTGCKNCYAERMSKRLAGRFGYPEAPDNFKTTLHYDRLAKPNYWKKPRTVFVGSMTDIFHNDVPNEYLDRLFATMSLLPQHIFQILTKRPNRMKAYIACAKRPFLIQKAIDGINVDLAANKKKQEEWREIPGYRGVYEVSDRGRIRRIDDNAKGKRNPEGILRPRITRGGYLAISLSVMGQVRQFRINRLVLMAFIGQPPIPNAETCHLNGIPTDNRIENLIWGTKTDNMGDASRHGTAGTWAKSNAKFNAEQIREIRYLRKKGIKLDDIASQYNANRKQISAICLEKIYRPAAITYPLPNVWLGVSAENQEQADKRIPILLQIPAAIRFISHEPALGPIDLTARWCEKDSPSHECDTILDHIDWVIAGCESGPGRRPTDIKWLKSIKNQCVEAGVPFFLKQANGYINGKSTVVKMPILDGKVWDQHPK